MRHADALGLMALLVSLALASVVRAQENDVLVLTALPATYSISHALAEGTSIRVENVPERGRRMNALPNLLHQRGEQFAEQFSGADAVVTIGKLWREDPLFVAVRSANVRVVDIDATKPWSMTLEGVSVALEPRQDAPWSEAPQGERSPSLFFWLSPANGARMAEIIANDLMRLSPSERPTIERNLADVRRELLDLKLDYELRLAELPDVTVYALASEFVYLTTDMGLYVDGYFLKQDIDWVEEDLRELSRYLSDNAIRVVIHKWEPDEPIQAAIRQGGARLVVLDPLDAGLVEDGRLAPDSYLRVLRANLETLYEALRAANAP